MLTGGLIGGGKDDTPGGNSGSSQKGMRYRLHLYHSNCITKIDGCQCLSNWLKSKGSRN